MGSPRFFSEIVGKGQGLEQRRSPSLWIDEPHEIPGICQTCASKEEVPRPAP